MVEGPTTLALLDGQASVAEGALAVAASQVVLLEVRLADLTEDGPNGVSQLVPLLRRSVRLAADAPKKLLLLAVVDHEPSDASEAEITAIAAAQLEQLWSRVHGAEVDAPAASDVFELQCAFLPHPKAPDFGAAAEGLKGTVVEAAGRYSAVGAALAEAADALGAQPAAADAVTPGPAEVAAAYACGKAADAATKEFTKGLGALRKAAEATLLPDFGEQAAALLAGGLERFDEETAASAATDGARTSLRAQLRRALLLPYRKQLSMLQKQTLAKFRQKLGATRPSAEIEEELDSMVKELKAGYGEKAAQLTEEGLGFDDGFERRELYNTITAACEAHVENLRVQGLYLPVKAVSLPVDFSAHWLMLNPFGKDGRYDTLDSSDRPQYKPQAMPMKLSLDKGVPVPRMPDPKRMVFTDKMMS